MFFFFARANLLVIWNTCNKNWIRLNPQLSVCQHYFENSTRTLPFCFATESAEDGSSGYCDVYPGRLNISHPLISFRMLQYTFKKYAEMPSRNAIGCCSNVPELEKDIPYNLLPMIGKWCNKDVRDDCFCCTKTSKVSLWEPLKNSHWNLFRRLSKAIFKIFCLKPTSNLICRNATDNLYLPIWRYL